LVKRFLEAELLLTIGHKTKRAVKGQKLPGEQWLNTSSNIVGGQIELVPVGLSDLLVLIHAMLIQEWLIFLDSVFGEAVLYCFKNGLTDRLPSMSLNIKKMETDSLVKMRESICFALKEVFSFINYPDKIRIIHKISNVSCDEVLKQEMKKQVTVRNVFQHSRDGEVRQRDLDVIDSRSFEILDDSGNVQPYKLGDRIKLSKPEIDRLIETIKLYSQKFEVLK